MQHPAVLDAFRMQQTMGDQVKLGRRSFLAHLGGTSAGLTVARILGAHAAGLVALGSAKSARSQVARQDGELLIEPQQITSQSGVLSTSLTAAPGTVDLGGGFRVPGTLYNGSYLPPLLRVQMGDVLRIQLRNELPEDPTNLHFHGMGVSPRGNSDNVFIHVHTGQEFAYEVHIPARDRQGPGLFWYHPHAHGVVFTQLLGGMSGGLVISGFERHFPMLKDLPERFLLIKHIEHAGREVISINGQINPIVAIRPGEAQYWRIGHIGATLFIKFQIEGMPLYVIGTDGHALARPQRTNELFLGPGERIEAIVIGPAAAQYAMRTIPFQNQAWKAPDPAQQMARIVASGTVASGQPAEPQIMTQKAQGMRWIDEIRTAPIARRRTLVYSRTADRKKFMIDGHVMAEDRTDQTVRLGDTEEWTVINTDQQYHSFHIHQTAFLITEVNGVPRKSDSLHDTFSVPPATDLGPSSLKVIIPFTDPVILGRFVYHCHAVDHEDKGMMGVVEVVT